MNKNARIYVAGHRGLVGSAIIKNLKKRGYTNLITRTREELDLINTNSVADFFKEQKPDYVFLAAAKVGGIVANNKYRADFIYENLMIQNNVIHQSCVHNVKKLLFLGSTCIYPKLAKQPMEEDSLLTGKLEFTNEPYAIAKIAGIKMCESYNLQYGTNFISVMPTNLYGPNDNFDLEKSHVLPALIRKIHLGKALENNDWKSIKKDLNVLPIEGVSGKNSKQKILKTLRQYGIKLNIDSVQIEIWGSGKPMRELLWSEDMAEACLFIMQHVDSKDTVNDLRDIKNSHINIGTGIDLSIADLASVIKNVIGFKGSFSYNTDKPDGTMKKLTDVSKLTSLGWKYKVPLKDGIERLYKWYILQSK